MKALSILQPWAWLIVRPDLDTNAKREAARARDEIKDVENRRWPTNYHGRFLVHAGKTYSMRKHEEYTDVIAGIFHIQLPHFEQMARGCIVGEAFLFGCQRHSSSRWAQPDSWHFELRHQIPRTPVPYPGRLGFFEIPDDAVHTSAPGLFSDR